MYGSWWRNGHGGGKRWWFQPPPQRRRTLCCGWGNSSSRNVAPCTATTTTTGVRYERFRGPTAWSYTRRSYFAKRASPKGGADVVGMGITVSRHKGRGSAYCYGCGADLVRAAPDDGGETVPAGTMATVSKKKGYWAERNQMLQKASIKNWALCPRCSKLNKIVQNETSISDETAQNLQPDAKMRDVFRAEVAKIRAQETAVVVLCVDAANVSGTLVRTIRNYVGGHPILLAVTRCDLLPSYVWDDQTPEQLQHHFRHRAREIQPAAVYLCSEEKPYQHTLGGLAQLAEDLWRHLRGRDPYVVGAANIGKSTLTDLLIAGFVHRGERLGHFRERLAMLRMQALKRARVTKSALPGTTLQNIRVPCFVDHEQALWDTPGLLLDESLAHFPIRNFRQIRAQRPRQIQPQIMTVTEKAFALLIFEKNDDLPLLRVEVRTKKHDLTARSGDDDGPIHVVWNSILFDLQVKIVEIKVARDAEQMRVKQQQQQQQQRGGKDHPRRFDDDGHHHPHTNEDDDDDDNRHRIPLTAEERARRKQERKQQYLDRVEVEQKTMGLVEWRRKQAEERAQFNEGHRTKLLTQLTEVHQVIIENGVGMDICVANFGWIGFLASRTAMVKTFAPSTGVKVSSHPTLALPPSFGPYRIPQETDEESDGSDDDDDEFLDNDMDVDFDLDDGFDDIEGYDNMFGYEGAFDEADYALNDDNDGSGKNQRYYQRERYSNKNDDDEAQANDPWARYTGESVGWRFDANTDFSRVGWVSTVLHIMLYYIKAMTDYSFHGHRIMFLTHTHTRKQTNKRTHTLTLFCPHSC